MKIIISPAKRMKYDDFGAESYTKPVFSAQAEEIAAKMRGLDINTLKSVLKTNDKLTKDA